MTGSRGVAVLVLSSVCACGAIADTVDGGGDASHAKLDAGAPDVGKRETGSSRDGAGTDAETSSVTELAKGVVFGSLLALDDTTVYFTSTGEKVSDTGKVQKVPKAGGAVVDLVTGLGVPYGIAVDRSFVYYTDRFTNGVFKVKKGGGKPMAIATGQPHANRVALDATNLYWTNSGPSEVGDGSVVKMPLAGGAPVTLAAAVDLPEAIALDATDIYWTDTGAAVPGKVMRTKIDGSQKTPTTLAKNQSYALGIALEGDTLYWTTNGGIMKLSKTSDGTQPPVVVASRQEFPKDIAVDPVNVYWTNMNAVEAEPLAGGPRKELASVVYGDGIAVDSTWVFFVDAATGTNPGGVYRVGK